MNLLKMFLSNNSTIKHIQIIDSLDVDKTNKMALVIPEVAINTEYTNIDMILRVPNNTICDNANLVKVIDYLANGVAHFKLDERYFNMSVVWDKQIVYNSTDDRKNSLYVISLKIKIMEEK